MHISRILSTIILAAALSVGCAASFAQSAVEGRAKPADVVRTASVGALPAPTTSTSAARASASDPAPQSERRAVRVIVPSPYQR